MKFTVFMLTLTFLLLQGCTTKEVTPPLNSEQNISLNDSINTDKECVRCQEDTSEFEDEFASEEKEIIDPLSNYNRWMTSFNDAVIINALNPVSEAYAYVIPQPLRIGVSNFIHNINYPIRLVNNLLQLKFQNVLDETERFIVNSTVGLAGLMDPAKHHMNIFPHNEDFGQTLGHYGVDSGFHIVLPFFGPSYVRDGIGIFMDGYLSPLVNVRGLENYKIPQNLTQTIGIVTLHFVNKNSLHLGEYESLKKDAVDLYPFLRDIYEQKRTSDIAE